MDLDVSMHYCDINSWVWCFIKTINSNFRKHDLVVRKNPGCGLQPCALGFVASRKIMRDNIWF